jgi:TrwC relaxase
LAAEWFRQQERRGPKGDLELAAALARWSRPAPSAVGGYDLTFSPVKSVSTLWAIADLPVAAQIEQAHQATVAAALRFIEDKALLPGRVRAGYAKWTSPGWSPPRSPTATLASATRTCTPMSRSRTRCRPWASGGCRSTVASCTPRKSRRRNATEHFGVTTAYDSDYRERANAEVKKQARLAVQLQESLAMLDRLGTRLLFKQEAPQGRNSWESANWSGIRLSGPHELPLQLVPPPIVSSFSLGTSENDAGRYAEFAGKRDDSPNIAVPRQTILIRGRYQ